MLPTLGMREVRTIILVNGETESTLEGANMILEKVWVLV